MKLLLILLPLMSFASSDYYPWDWFSDPVIMAQDLRRNFRELPLEGKVISGEKFWSGDYWPLKRGNINYRWHSPRRTGFNLRSPTREEAQRMTQAELSHLSPSEKYDLYTGRYDYPLKHEVERISANPRAETWEGICHGWAPATMNHNEPTPKGATNPEGIVIPFGSADIKALISWYYANGFISPTHQMGRRCYGEGSEDECREDMNAGAFHIVLTNKIALRNEGIIVDLKHGGEVWNHPLMSYQSEFIKWSRKKRDSAPGTVRRAKIKTMVRVLNGTGNYWGQIRATSAQKEFTEKYVYYLDLNASHEIIGGDWDSEDRPDFLWVKYRPQEFTGILSRLGELLNDEK